MYYQLPPQFLPDSLYIASMNIILKSIVSVLATVL